MGASVKRAWPCYRVGPNPPFKRTPARRTVSVRAFGAAPLNFFR